MKKRWLTMIVLAVALCVTCTMLLPVEAKAAEVASGTCGAEGDNMTWVLDDSGTLTISGTGEMADYEAFDECAPWYNWAEKIVAVTIGDGVTYVGEDSFIFCDAVKAVTIPSGVKSIGARAFYGCAGLTTVTICEGVEIIGTQAFDGCSGLKQVTIGTDISKIGNFAFQGCTSLETIVIPATVESVGVRAFSECSALKNVTIAASTTTIEAGAFGDCTGLVHVTIPAGTRTISVDMFEGCIRLERVDIPDSVVRIESFAFDGCISLIDVTLPAGLNYLDGSAFQNCSSLTQIIIPGSVQDVDHAAFRGCSGLRTVILEDGVPSIDWYAFKNCSSLNYIVIPDSVTEINGSAFEGCGSLWHVIYKGAEEDWNNLPIGESNEDLMAATRHYSCTGNEIAKTVYKEGLCTDGGKLVTTCSVCHETLEEDLMGEDHGMGAWEVVAGVSPLQEKRGCANCSYQETRTLLLVMVTEEPAKLVYLEGEGFDPAGLEVMTYYDNDSVATVTDYIISGYDSTPGVKTITISYGGCTTTFEVEVQAKPAVDGVHRIFGSNRFATAFGAADLLKENLGVEKFENIIVACGDNFADALAGSYLSKVKNAPILLVQPNMVSAVQAYIEANLQPGGTIYLLGGEPVVPGAVAEGLSQFTAKRLAGLNRFETNLEILREAGFSGGEILVCTAYEFADSLSASAVGKPILLVDDDLTEAQKAYLAGLTNDSYVIVGGTGAVSAEVETSLQSYGTVERLAGANRFATSVLVAERFFENPTSAVVAYAYNFPDGLCGGPLAMNLGGPLLLADDNGVAIIREYTEENGICDGVVLGGSPLVKDTAVREIFAMQADDSILVK